MKRNVINSVGVSGLKVEFNMFNIYKLKELQAEFNRAKADQQRHNEISAIGYDKRTDEEKKEFAMLRTAVHPNALENIRLFLNNLLANFEEEKDDLFVEPQSDPDPQVLAE